MSLENHVHIIRHLDDFTIDETESFVVVKDGVHIFDPVGIDRSVEDDPLPMLLGVLVSTLAEEAADDAVLELLRNKVVAAIQLFNGHALWVQHKAFSLSLFK